MNPSSSGDVVVVTGAAGALGGELARTLSARGHKLALLDRPAAHGALATLAEQLGGQARAHAYPAELAETAAWRELPERITHDLGAPPTGAALIAGGWAGGEPLAATKDVVDWDAMLRANADTVHRALFALLPGMLAAKRGSIVVVGSRVVERPWTGAGQAAYTASKAAAVALAQSVAAEVLEGGVRVNAILPSTMDTPANRRAMPDADSTRWVSLPSAAGVIAFLLSDAARDISGAAIPLYGRG